MKSIHIAILIVFASAACAKSGARPAPATPPAEAQPGEITHAFASLDGAGESGLVASDSRNAGTAEIVRAGIRARLPDMRTCYEALLAAQPTLAGTVVATFDIAPDGVVTQIAAVGVAPALEACVATSIKQIKFDIATDGPVHIKAYPIKFNP